MVQILPAREGFGARLGAGVGQGVAQGQRVGDGGLRAEVRLGGPLRGAGGEGG